MIIHTTLQKLTQIFNSIKKLYKLLGIIEINNQGDLLIKPRGSLLMEGEYIVMSTDRNSKEQLRDIREGLLYDSTEDGSMYRTPSLEIDTKTSQARSNLHRLQ